MIKKLEGVGDKIGRLIIRDLLFIFKDKIFFSRNFPNINNNIYNLIFAIPIDSWVRSIALTIPSIREKVREKEKSNNINENLRQTIVDFCREIDINPLRFDYGVYNFGRKISVFKSVENTKDLLNLL